MAQPMPILKSTKNGVVSRTHPDVILTWFWMALYNERYDFIVMLNIFTMGMLFMYSTIAVFIFSRLS